MDISSVMNVIAHENHFKKKILYGSSKKCEYFFWVVSNRFTYNIGLLKIQSLSSGRRVFNNYSSSPNGLWVNN